MGLRHTIVCLTAALACVMPASAQQEVTVSNALRRAAGRLLDRVALVIPARSETP